MKPLCKRAEPIEHLDRRRHCDDERQQREGDVGIERGAGHEHVVAPHEEADDRDRNRGPGDELVAEHAFPRERRDNLAHHPEPGQDHDVNRRVRVEPEQVLKQQRVAAQRRVEHADAKDALEQQQHHSHGQHRRRQHVDDARAVEGPEKQRQPVPAHAGRPQLVDRDDEIQPRRDGGIAGQDDAKADQRDVATRIVGGERRVKGPACIHAAHREAGQSEHTPAHEQIPAREVDARKGEIPRPQHQRRHEIPERHRYRRHQEEPHHHDAVQREQPVVHFVIRRRGRRATSGSAASPPPRRRRGRKTP